MKRDVLVLKTLLPQQMSKLGESYSLHRYDLEDDTGRKALLKTAGARCQAVVTDSDAGLTRELIDQLPSLQFVACSSAGYETVDVAALKERGIRMTNAADALLDDVADTAMLLMLASRRRMIDAHRHVVSGDWGRKGEFPLQSSLKGKRLGIVGMGKIGQHLVGRARAFGLEIAYFNRTRREGVDIVFQPDLVELAKWADILIVIVAGGAGTRNLINEKILRALGPQGTLINISRGSVVDESALIAALKDGGLGTAALDVFLNEPCPNPDLTALPNVTLLPHLGSATVESRTAMAQIVVDNLEAHFAGMPLRSVVI